MKSVFLSVLIILSSFALFVISACSKSEPATTPTPTPTLPLITNPTPTPTTTPTLTLTLVQTPTQTITPRPEPTIETKSVKITDQVNDALDKSGNPINADPGMDIIEAQVSLDNQNYTVKIKVKDNIPSKVDAPGLIEWDILIDSDLNPNTGWNSFLLFNDIGVDYYIDAALSGQQFSSMLRNIQTNKWVPINYSVNGDTIELSFPKSAIGEIDKFNFIIAVRQYGKQGDGSSLLSFDKAPNQGHGQFP